MTPPSDSIEAALADIAKIRYVWDLAEDDGLEKELGRNAVSRLCDHIDALADRAREAERARDEAIKQRDYDYGRFSDAKQAVIAADSERIAAEAEAKALREALLRIEVLLDSPRVAEPFVRGQALGEAQRALGVT